VTVRAQDGQVTHFRVQAARNLPCGRVGWKQSIFVQV
jgi:hypothetical protein